MSRYNNILVMGPLGFVLAVAGCSSNRPDMRAGYNGHLRAAHTQIQAGHSDQALQTLNAAQQLAQAHGYDQTDVVGLSVEAHLGQGDIAAAHDRAQALLESQPQSNYAHELMGKVLLKKGRYAEAETHFVQASKGVRTTDDRARLDDLIATSRYFAAYEAGQTQQAGRYLRDIQNGDLQHALDETTQDVSIGGS